MDVREFSQLLFRRRQSDNFQEFMSFQFNFKTQAQLELLFYNALSIHALDHLKAFAHLLPSTVVDAEFNITELIHMLNVHFEGFEFEKAGLINPVIIFLTPTFVQKVKAFFETHHPTISTASATFLQRLSNINKKQANALRKTKERAVHTPMKKAVIAEKKSIYHREVTVPARHSRPKVQKVLPKQSLRKIDYEVCHLKKGPL